MLQEVLDNALGIFAQQGFWLSEPDDHVIELWHKGKLVDRFTQEVSIVALHNACRDYLRRGDYHE